MQQAKPAPWLQRSFSQVPITALAFYQPRTGRPYVLAGEDADLCVYAAAAAADDDGAVPQPGPVLRFAVFDDQPIHGIHVQQQRPGGGGCGCRVLVWGASSVAVFEADGFDSGKGPALHRVTAPDWIYDGAISPYDATSAVLISAHNEIIQARLASDSLVLGEAISPARPILFSGALAWESPTAIFTVGGTAFGEIFVWRCHLDRPRAAQCEVLFVLAGHEGSIFGVDICPPLAMSDGSSARLLASCSDDRTVRVWDVTDRLGAASHTHAELSKARETGFGATAWEFARPLEPVAVAMGHLSRIWGVRFVTGGNEKPQGDVLRICSFGEDSIVQNWRLSLNLVPAQGQAGEIPPTALTGTLTPGETISSHDGKHLWSNAMMYSQERTLIATGGADSKISIIEEPAMASEISASEKTNTMALMSRTVTTMDIRAILSSLSAHPMELSGTEIINRYDFISPVEILATTSLGRVLLGTFSCDLKWTEVCIDLATADDLRSCCVIKRTGNGMAVLGTTSGSVYFYCHPNGVSLVTHLPGKVVQLYCLSGGRLEEEEGGTVTVLLFLHGSSVGHTIEINPRSGVMQTHEEICCLDERFVAASSAKVGSLLFIGSRHGWLSLLRRDESEYRALLHLATPCRDTITAIIPLPRKTDQEYSPLYVLTTGRDGKYRIYRVEVHGEHAEVHLHHESSPPFGPVIEGAWFTDVQEPELILYGFKGKNFVVWNETRREELVSVECGGAHRTFSLTPPSRLPDCFRFAFTKTSKLCLFSQDTAVHRSVKTGTHGREIRALSCTGRYIASAAEDTTIRIWEHTAPRAGDAPQMQCVAYMKAHTTGIQCLRWLGAEYLFSSAGNEEFMVWRVRQLDANYPGLGVVCENVYHDKSADGDLRIMDFDVGRCEATGSIVVTLAFSSSVLKTYRYSIDSGFEALATASYTGACLTTTRHLHMSSRDISVITAATDGHIAIWRAVLAENGAQKYVLQQVVKVHQSTIKSLDMVRKEDRYWILTGGDDNALGLVIITEAPSEAEFQSHIVLSRGIVRRAHAAAINGVALLLREGELLGVTASNDQRVKLWRIGTAGSPAVGLLADACSGVADAAALELVNRGMSVAVAGVGVEIWDLAPLMRAETQES